MSAPVAALVPPPDALRLSRSLVERASGYDPAASLVDDLSDVLTLAWVMSSWLSEVIPALHQRGVGAQSMHTFMVLEGITDMTLYADVETEGEHDLEGMARTLRSGLILARSVVEVWA